MTESDELMNILAAEARRRRDAEPDARWDEVAVGALSEPDIDALVAEELARGTSPEALKRTREAFQPLDEAESLALEDGIMDALRPKTATAPKVDEIAARRAARARMFVGGFGLSVAAAAMLLLFLPANPSGLPEYELELSGGSQRERSVQEAHARFGVDDHVVVVLRPSEQTAQSVSAHAYRMDPEGPVLLEVPIEVSSTGAVRLDVRAGDLASSFGTHAIALSVRDAHGDEQRFTVRFEIVER